MITPAAGSLSALLATIPDPRGRQGLRHPLAAMLAATVCGILTGARGCEAIAQWIRNQEAKFWHVLGFKRRPPCANCYRDLLAEIPAEMLEGSIAEWIPILVPDPPTTASSTDASLSSSAVYHAPPQPVALDGKTLCKTMQAHGRSIHLLSLLDQQTGGVLRQLAMPSDTNEHKAALELLKQIVLKGRVITGDAMFCQREVCQQIIDSGGDYMFVVKDNQPELKAAISAEFEPHFSPCG